MLCADGLCGGLYMKPILSLLEKYKKVIQDALFMTKKESSTTPGLNLGAVELIRLSLSDAG